MSEFLAIGKSETTYNWYVKRGCDTSKKILSGTSAASGLFGIKQTDYACTFQNGTLCNAQIANYDTSLQIKFQTVGMLRCMQCLTPEDNTDKDRDQLLRFRWFRYNIIGIELNCHKRSKDPLSGRSVLYSSREPKSRIICMP